MNTTLYFLIKFYPFWGPITALSLIPLCVKLFKRKAYVAGTGLLLLVFILVFLTYLYIVKDGFHNAVPFLRQWLV